MCFFKEEIAFKACFMTVEVLYFFDKYRVDFTCTFQQKSV